MPNISLPVFLTAEPLVLNLPPGTSATNYFFGIFRFERDSYSSAMDGRFPLYNEWYSPIHFSCRFQEPYGLHTVLFHLFICHFLFIVFLGILYCFRSNAAYQVVTKIISGFQNNSVILLISAVLPFIVSAAPILLIFPLLSLIQFRTVYEYTSFSRIFASSKVFLRTIWYTISHCISSGSAGSTYFRNSFSVIRCGKYFFSTHKPV